MEFYYLHSVVSWLWLAEEIFLTCEQLRQAAGKLHAANRISILYRVVFMFSDTQNVAFVANWLMWIKIALNSKF